MSQARIPIAEYEQAMEQLAGAMGSAERAWALAAGALLTLDEAVLFALDGEESPD